MTDPISVLLIIGELYLGPFAATKAELDEWAYVRDNKVIVLYLLAYKAGPRANKFQFDGIRLLNQMCALHPKKLAQCASQYWDLLPTH